MGWSLGIGRAGSIAGPLVAGWLIGLHWSNGALFVAAALPALLSCAMVFCMGRTGFGKGNNGNNGAATREGEKT